VWSLAKRLSRDTAALEDAVQEIFIAIWKNAGRYDPAKASEPTFIAMIARRRIIDRQRRVARSPTLEALEDTSAGAEHAEFAEVDLGDEARRARAAMALLSHDQRRLILMSVVEGRTHQEIATATGIPLGTVKSHIRRGLDKTAQILRSREEESP
jgi:RNA polymerase sigma-70 factor (ECF subfamily)